jgi:hypothetical protein
MTETSGPPRPVGSVADLRTRQADRTSHAMAQWEAEQLQAATDFGKRYGNALLDGLTSTKNAFLAERDQTARQIHNDAEAIRLHSQQLAAAARTAARMWWLPTLAISLLLIAGSLGFAWTTVTAANQAPGQTQTFTKNGQTWEVLTGPNWTTCPYNGQQRPCRPAKD